MELFLPFMAPGAIFAVDEKLQGGESEAVMKFARDNCLCVQKPGTMQVPMIATMQNL